MIEKQSCVCVCVWECKGYIYRSEAVKSQHVAAFTLKTQHTLTQTTNIHTINKCSAGKYESHKCFDSSMCVRSNIWRELLDITPLLPLLQLNASVLLMHNHMVKDIASVSWVCSCCGLEKALFHYNDADILHHLLLVLRSGMHWCAVLLSKCDCEWDLRVLVEGNIISALICYFYNIKYGDNLCVELSLRFL